MYFRNLALLIICVPATFLWLGGLMIGLIILGYQIGVWLQSDFIVFPGSSLGELITGRGVNTFFRYTLVDQVAEILNSANLPSWVLDRPVWLTFCGINGMLTLPLLYFNLRNGWV